MGNPQRALTGRTALVTGASRGIGLAIAKALQQNGAQVVRLARSLEPAFADRQTDLPCDVTREEDLRRVAARLGEVKRVPDILVNNAGIFLLKPLLQTTADEFREQLKVNLVGPFLVLRTFLPYLIAREAGDVVTIGSVADHMALPGNAAYGASKWGLRGLHGVMATECAGSGVRATLISPSATDTPLWDAIDPDHREGLPRRADMLRPEDVAAAVVSAVTQPQGVSVGEIRLERS
ncbi:MAG: SDR family oxidoreductase [Gemmatimonadetes bacterium]|nr:SDR family oxidoreductase [Gemmatimonadota bacterium]